MVSQSRADVQVVWDILFYIIMDPGQVASRYLSSHLGGGNAWSSVSGTLVWISLEIASTFNGDCLPKSRLFHFPGFFGCKITTADPC